MNVEALGALDAALAGLPEGSMRSTSAPAIAAHLEEAGFTVARIEVVDGAVEHLLLAQANLEKATVILAEAAEAGARVDAHLERATAMLEEAREARAAAEVAAAAARIGLAED